MLVIVAPGQGAQTPGFLTPWLEIPGVTDRLRAWSQIADLDLVAAGTTAGAEEIRDTAVAQPLLVAAGLAAADVLFGHLEEAAACVGAVAGHSVGELTAAAVAGVLTPEQAMTLVRERGRGMAEAAAATETGMTAVLGGEESEVLAALAEHGLTPANMNGAGQIVAAGTLPQLAALAEAPPPRARLRALQVAGAFHTEHMAPATERLRAAAAGIAPGDPRTRLLSNRDGAVVPSGADYLQRMIDQVSGPVRWDLCMAALAELGAGAIIELPPAGTLVGIAKRTLAGVSLLALKTPDDLAAARALIAAHATATDAHPPEWRLLVAPLAGTYHRVDAPDAGPVPPGGSLGRVVARGDEHAVAAPFAGTVLEWLVEDGDPVSAGQPLVRLHPEVGSP